MKAANGNKTRAAEALGLNRTTLIDKLKRVGTEQPD
jgi:DNA-binding protein Fis